MLLVAFPHYSPTRRIYDKEEMHMAGTLAGPATARPRRFHHSRQSPQSCSPTLNIAGHADLCRDERTCFFLYLTSILIRNEFCSCSSVYFYQAQSDNNLHTLFYLNNQPTLMICCRQRLYHIRVVFVFRIFLCNWKTPYRSASPVGGHPGT